MNIKTVSIYKKRDEKGKEHFKTEEVFNKINTLLVKCGIKIVEKNPDLVIAIGGDGTFIDACRGNDFNDKSLYVGVHTGTLGFLQDLSPDEFYTLLNNVIKGEDVVTEEINIGEAILNFENGEKLTRYFLNELEIGNNQHSRVDVKQFANGIFLQEVYVKEILVSTIIGQTGELRSFDGPIIFTNEKFLISKLLGPMKAPIFPDFERNDIVAYNFKYEFANLSYPDQIKLDCRLEEFPRKGNSYKKRGDITSIEVNTEKKLKKIMLYKLPDVDIFRNKLLRKK